MRKILVAILVGLSVGAVAHLPAPARGELKTGQVAPELVGDQWTGARQSLGSLRGKVVILHFWTFGCINCKHNLPAYSRLQKVFQGKAVTMIGIHTPETAEEGSFENLRAAVRRLGVSFDSLHDPQGRNWTNYRVQYWPTVYVIDKRGIVRGSWAGELNYGNQFGEDEVKGLVGQLLKE